MQSLNGVLDFACIVTRPGRAFLRRLIDLTVCARFLDITLDGLDCEVKGDLKHRPSLSLDFDGRFFFLGTCMAQFVQSKSVH